VKVIPSKDFHFSLDGIRPTLYKKGVEVDIPEKVVEKLQIAGGYLVGSEKNIEPEEISKVETKTSLDEVKGMKKIYLSLLKTIGVETVEQLKTKTVEELSALDGISPKTATQLLNEVK
jgi:hypothetical protein